LVGLSGALWPLSANSPNTKIRDDCMLLRELLRHAVDPLTSSAFTTDGLSRIGDLAFGDATFFLFAGR
jgi:hypothetical protein